MNVLQRVLTFPTPDLRDVLFYVEKSGSVTANQSFVYGEPHPDSVDYPDHKLVFVASAPTGDDPYLQRWFYAADREDQGKHNWQVSYPYAGLPSCPRFSCVFIEPLETFAPLARGTKHPLDLGDDTPTEDARFVGAKLMFEREVEIPEELRSIYRAVQRVYDKVPSFAEQLTHNVETSYPYAGLVTCPRYTRTLVIPREEYAGVAKGTVDPIHTSAKLIDETQVESNDEIIQNLYVISRRVYDEVPSIAAQEAFNFEIEYPYHSNTSYPRTVRRYVIPRADIGTAVIPSAGLSLGGATLAARRVDRFQGQAEDSLYVLVTTVHDKIPNLGVTDDLNFLKTYGYRVTRPYGTDDHPRVEWRIPALKSGYSPAVDYAACPITGYTGLLLTDETVGANPENVGTVDVLRVYDSLPGPALESEEREKFADVPQGFIIERKIETIRQPVKNDATIGSLNTDSPDGVGGALIQTRLGVGGANAVILEKGSTRLTVSLGTLTGQDIDMETGRVYDFTREIVAAGTAGSGVDPITGEYSIVDPLNQYFSIKETRPATTLGTGDDSLTWDDIVNWSWPAVLEAIDFFVVEAKDGHLIRYGYDVDLKEAYSGPCRASITESWSPVPQALPSVVAMLPRAIEFDFPLTRNFSIPQTLHPAITLTETVGTDHPDLAYTITTKTFAATNYTDWPTSIIASATQVPYRGGFKRRVVTVYKPGT